MDNNNLIGKRINEALAIREVKQKELAKILGVQDNTVSYWCSGSRTPNTHQIIQIAKVLNVSTDFLLGFTKAATDDKDLQFVCDYTGLSKNTIRFFEFNKSIDHLLISPNALIQFIEYLVYKTALNSYFTFNLDKVKDDTMAYVNELKKAVDSNTPKENIDTDKIRGLGININALRYTLTKQFTNFIEEFGISEIEDFTLSDLDYLENEYYKRLSDDEQ